MLNNCVIYESNFVTKCYSIFDNFVKIIIRLQSVNEIEMIFEF